MRKSVSLEIQKFEFNTGNFVSQEIYSDHVVKTSITEIHYLVIIVLIIV